MTTTETFRWFPSVGGNNRWCYAVAADQVPVKVTHLTITDVLMIEAIDTDRMPVRTLSVIHLDGRSCEDFLTVLAVKPS